MLGGESEAEADADGLETPGAQEPVRWVSCCNYAVRESSPLMRCMRCTQLNSSLPASVCILYGIAHLLEDGLFYDIALKGRLAFQLESDPAPIVTNKQLKRLSLCSCSSALSHKWHQSLTPVTSYAG